ncbi:MAG: PH domain-containing protein [Candidatus Liptonbacteria bacterium]|nr:PH domain-containing protein [Candidatus Liptonbacteria bacterium]
MDQDYQRLGYKTLWLFILERSTIALIALLIASGMFMLLGQDLPTDYSALGQFTVNVHQLVRLVALIAFLGFVIAFLLAALIGWLVYIHYEFQLGDHALKIKRGIFHKEEIAIPYRQIQNVNVRRDVAYQIFGLSKLIIQSAGHDDPNDPHDDAQGVLPALDRHLAESAKEEILKRSNVEKVVMHEEGASK